MEQTQAIAINLEYLINCRNCHYCWSASRQEIIDADILSCPCCDSSDLKKSKVWEI